MAIRSVRYPTDICDDELAEVRALMADWHHECLSESHTYNGQPIVVLDEDGQASTTGTGYFAWPDGTRFSRDNPPDWPKGHIATPCGKCDSCRLSALGCGLIDVQDGRGSISVSLAQMAKP